MNEAPGPNYSSSALIVWDMQNGIASRAFNFDTIVTNVKKMLDAFHASGRPVIYSQHTGLPYEYLSKSMIAFMQKRGLDPKKGGFLQEGTPDWEIVKKLSPAETDLVLRKYTASFFIGTILDQLLRNRGVDTLVLAGVSTEGGIEGTARHASYLGYFPVVTEDAVGSFDREAHEAALRLMGRMFEVRTSKSIIADVAVARQSR
jgi:nicotinamidase-related amidase